MKTSCPASLKTGGQSPEQRFAQTEMHEILSEAHRPPRAGFPGRFLCCATSKSFPPKKTAKVVGVSVAAVKSRLLRARLKLRQKLNRYFRQGWRKLNCKGVIREISDYIDGELDLPMKQETGTPSRALWGVQDGGRSD